MSLPIISRDLAAADSGSPQSSPAAVAIPAVNFLRLVFNGDIILLVLFACFVVVSLPRAFARLSSAWSQGHILRSLADNQRNRKVPVSTSSNTEPGQNIEMKSDNSHTAYSYTDLAQRENGNAAFPYHVPTWSTLLYPIASPLKRRTMPGFSLGQTLILVIYSTILIYLSLYQSSAITDPERTGVVAMSQIPFVFAFAMKNNLLGAFVGLGYEKINYLHRFAGRAIVILVNIHSTGFVYKWTLNGEFAAQASQPTILWAFVALASVNIMAFTSATSMRQASYRLFICTHVIGFTLFLTAVCFHKPVVIPYVFAAVILYGVDHLVRLVKMRICTVRIRPLPELSTTRIEVPKLNAGWRAGQHVRLRVLSSRMGWWGWTENHPFTIASVSETEEGLVLMCKKTGKWTGKLYDMALASGYGEGGSNAGGNVRAMIEGPYGGPGHSVYESYSAAVFVCGGSGISFGLSAVQDLVRKDLEGRSRVKVIELIWTVQDPASLVILIPLFTSLIQQSASIRISVFYTRATPGVVRITKDYLLPGLSLTPGRPRVGKVIDSVISRAVSLGSGAKDSEPLSGVFVGACGPVGLADEVVKVVGQVDGRRRKAVGGVEVHEEVFGW
ncbi:hypothetical protein PILCRDRAFT_825962 [Piloderma croceum F 1598]|uniref:ferric-chelate reductase (NADPH) n=1 Tax=Piloderma croceum (strain F 1598) TaxID=765440 RepID=A0A0C3FB49_PILCF|nr:hypothetical protein PILCRDRAFT_825962 [Piloderma croceum F 1598]